MRFLKKDRRASSWLWGTGALLVVTAAALWRRHAKHAWDTDLDLHDILDEITAALSLSRTIELIAPYEQEWRLRDSAAFPAMS